MCSLPYSSSRRRDSQSSHCSRFAQTDRNGTVRSFLYSTSCRSFLLTSFVYSYVHLLCAVYHPELRFTEPSRLEIVEGFASLPQRRAKEVIHPFPACFFPYADGVRSFRLVLSVFKKVQELRFPVLVAPSTFTSLVHTLRITRCHSRFKRIKAVRRNRRKLLRSDSRKKKVSCFPPCFPFPHLPEFLTKDNSMK